MALRTSWTRPIDNFAIASRDGGDPLGFRAYATRLARQIVPGITRVTSTTRGFSVLCLGIDLTTSYAANEQEAREIFQKWERMWVAAQVHHLGDAATFPGLLRANQILNGLPRSQPYPLTKPLLTAQLSSGVWGGYRRAASAFRLISGAGQRSLRLSEVKLTKDGGDLMRHLRKTCLDGVQAATWVQKDAVPRSLLEKLRADRSVSKGEVQVLTRMIEAYDEYHDRSLGHLRAVYDQHGSAITVFDLPGAELSGRQAIAVPQAVALLEAIEEIEFRFRDWVVTGIEPAWPKTLLRLPIWQIADPQEVDLTALRARMASAQTGAIGRAVLAHHQHLSAARGARAWELGSNASSAQQRRLPSFALDALSSLFDEGVAPHA